MIEFSITFKTSVSRKINYWFFIFSIIFNSNENTFSILLSYEKLQKYVIFYRYYIINNKHFVEMQQLKKMINMAFS